MSERGSREAFVTLTTNDAYSVGALVLGQSLRNANTTRQLVVMVTSQVSQLARDQLAQSFDHVVEVDVLDSGDVANLALLTRPDLGLTFTKLHCWRLTQFSKCVFLDADTLVLQNVDELFDYEELAAAPDVGWPDCFNSGVFVFRPSEETYRTLLNFAITHGSFDGGDQGLLNLFFSDWPTQGPKHRLPFIYNTVAQAFYSYAPAFKRFGHNVKVIHFIGAVKPWHVGFNTATRTLQGEVGESREFIQQWWNVFMNRVHPHLPDVMKLSLAEKGPQATFGPPTGGEQPFSRHQVDDSHRQYSWERGQIDYMGVDSFENIKRQLDAKILPGNSGDSSGKPVPVNGKAEQVNGEVEVKKTAAKDLGAGPPVHFDEDSEFHKNSIDALIRPAPKRSVHRTTLVIPRKVYNDHVKTLSGPTQGKAAPKVEAASPVKAESEPKSAALTSSPTKPLGTTGVAAEEHRPVACSYVAAPPAEDVPPPYQQFDPLGTSAPTTGGTAGKASPSGVEASLGTADVQWSPTGTAQGKTSSPGLATGSVPIGFESFSPSDIRESVESTCSGFEGYPADPKSHWSSTEPESDGSFATGFESFSSPSLSKGGTSSSGLETGGSATYVFESFSSSSTTGGHVSSPGGLESRGGFMESSAHQPEFSLTTSSPTASGQFSSGFGSIGTQPIPEPSAGKGFTVETSISSKSSGSSKTSVDPFASQESSRHFEASHEASWGQPVPPESPPSQGAATTPQKPSGTKKAAGKRGKK